jgi:hypothetical protein
LKVIRGFGSKRRLHLQDRRKAEKEAGVEAGGKETLKMEMIFSYAMQVDFQLTTRIPEDSTQLSFD